MLGGRHSQYGDSQHEHVQTKWGSSAVEASSVATAHRAAGAAPGGMKGAHAPAVDQHVGGGQPELASDVQAEGLRQNSEVW